MSKFFIAFFGDGFEDVLTKPNLPRLYGFHFDLAERLIGPLWK
jgi:hypothetical protein